MKKILIIEANAEKINATIKTAEGRATARTITAKMIMDRLAKIKVPKNRLDGTMLVYDGAEHFPSAYRYRPESTHFKAENRKGKWYLVDVYRDTCPNRYSYDTSIQYSEAAKEWIIEQASKF